LSIIDTISEGFRITTKKLWLIAVPVVLDLALWWSPKISIAPVIEKMMATVTGAAAAMGTDQAGTGQMLDLAMEQLQGTVGRTNLLALLAWSRLGVPSIAGVRLIEPGVDRVVEIGGYGSMLLAQFGIMALGLVLACFFLGLLGQQAGEGKASLISVLGRLPRYWLYLVALLAPLGLALIMVFSIGLLLGPFAPFLWISMLWLLLYFSFVPQAITMGQDKPLGALMASFSVVRLNFWPTLGLIVLTNVISTGLALLWRELLGSTAGTFLAILINAYIGTGLALAVFVFYRDRLAMLREAVEQQRSMTPNG
jgi:hypothetical protein